MLQNKSNEYFKKSLFYLKMNGKTYITDMELAPPKDCCTKWMHKFKTYNDANIKASLAGHREEECLKKAIETTEADSDWQNCQSEWMKISEENEVFEEQNFALRA